MKKLIVINSINRPESLVLRSLNAAVNQAQEHDKILFIDQNKVPTALPEKLKAALTHIQYPVASVSSARNYLLTWEFLDNFEWIIFCDDDGYFSNGYLKRFEQIIAQNTSLSAVAGSIKINGTNDFYSPRHKMGGSLKSVFNYKLLMGSNFAVKVETFKQLNGFDERFGAGAYWGSSEESDFSLKLFFSQSPMEYFKDLIVYHEAPRSGSRDQECKKAYRYGQGKGALVKKWIFDESKPQLIFEFLEMLVVPILQFFVHALKLNKNAFIFLYMLSGRLNGFWRAFRYL